MEGSRAGAAGVSSRSVVLAVVGYAGLAMCITLLFLGMRAVMDVGGACAEGGPYVSAQSCPEGSTAATLLGILGGFLFGAIATAGGIGVGGIWAAAPLLAWSALFASLGWNFLQYGIFSAPPETGIEWGWAIPGILFMGMAVAPLLVLLPVVRGRVPVSSARGTPPPALSGLGQPPRGPQAVGTGSSPVTATRDGTMTPSGSAMDGETPDEIRAQLEQAAGRLDEAASGAHGDDREELARIAADFGAAIGAAMADTPIDPDARQGATPAAEPEAEFTEGTQALLDRLERLADMRDRGLLGAGEYDTAKAAIMAELEART